VITIVRGPLPLVRAHRAFQPGAGVLRLDLAQDLAIPWLAMRALLGQLRARAGDARVDEALAPHRAHLSLVLRRLEPLLTPAERAIRTRDAAQRLGYLSHNVFLLRPLNVAWSGTIAELLDGIDTLQIPDASALDPESMNALGMLLRHPAAAKLHLAIGHDPEAGAPASLWRRSTALVAANLALLEARPGTQVHSLAGSAGAIAPPPAPALDPLDDPVEQRARDRLADPSPLDRQASGEVLEAVRGAFASFGFTAALKLGLALYGRVPTLTNPELAELRTLIALSAYNRQVSSDGNLELAALLDRHFSDALKLETDPAQRSHLLYRLCINSGRRAGDLPLALELADQAIAETLRDGIPKGLAAFCEAWALNGRAYVLQRMGRTAEAVDDCVEGLSRLGEAARGAGAPASEVGFSRLVLCDNLAELATRAQDLPLAISSQSKLEALENELPNAPRISFFRWSKIHRAQGRLREAAKKAETGLGIAQQLLDPLAEDLLRTELGELYYRMGNVERSLLHLEQALEIRRRAAEPDEVVRTELSCAIAAMRAGQLQRAEEIIDTALDRPLLASGRARAEALALVGLLCAKQGAGDAADAATNDAIELSVAAGERDTMLRVARSAGDACLALGRKEAALAAFTQALEIASTGESPPPSEVVGALLGSYEAGRAERDLVERAHALMPAALADPETWWDLPRLAAALAAHAIQPSPPVAAALAERA
jgi:tetratricopeptide (TPR) repeat protein